MHNGRNKFYRIGPQASLTIVKIFLKYRPQDRGIFEGVLAPDLAYVSGPSFKFPFSAYSN